MNTINIPSIDFRKGGGLVPVVVQEESTGQILMLAYADKEAVEKTLETGYAHYHSRERGKLWRKGETSGNLQKITKILADCDKDTLVYIIKQKGVACHTGNKSCFFTELQ